MLPLILIFDVVAVVYSKCSYNALISIHRIKLDRFEWSFCRTPLSQVGFKQEKNSLK